MSPVNIQTQFQSILCQFSHLNFAVARNNTFMFRQMPKSINNYLTRLYIQAILSESHLLYVLQPRNYRFGAEFMSGKKKCVSRERWRTRIQLLFSSRQLRDAHVSRVLTILFFINYSHYPVVKDDENVIVYNLKVYFIYLFALYKHNLRIYGVFKL